MTTRLTSSPEIPSHLEVGLPCIETGATMCREMVFAGNCTRCGQWFQWTELSSELQCLEAKNNGVFGDCRRGIETEQHPFDQECDACAEEQNVDEGVGGFEEDYELQQQAHEQQDPKFYGGEWEQQAAAGSGKTADSKGKGRSREGSKEKGDRDKGRNKRQRTS